MDVPLRVQRSAHTAGRAGGVVVGELEGDGQGAGVGSDRVDPADRPHRHLPAGVALAGGAGHAEHLRQEVGQGVGVRQGVLEQLEDLALLALLLVVVGLGHLADLDLEAEVLVRRPPSRPDVRRPQQAGGPDDAEPAGRFRDRPSTAGNDE